MGKGPGGLQPFPLESPQDFLGHLQGSAEALQQCPREPGKAKVGGRRGGQPLALPLTYTGEGGHLGRLKLFLALKLESYVTCKNAWLQSLASSAI